MNYSLGSLALAAYFLGAIPFSLLICTLKGVDLRSVGSGNIGATNVYRVLGFKLAFLVFFLDALKGFLPVYLALQVFESPLLHILIGSIAIVGHSLTIFAGFKGGKGAATGLGVLAAICPDVCLIIIVLAGVIIGITRYVSVASIVSSILTPLFIHLFGYPIEYVMCIGGICGFILYRHKSNIERLMSGKEHKI